MPNSAEATLFVFYKNPNAENWTYSEMPSEWWWVGGGITKTEEYPQEEQFSGPRKNKEEMRRFLNITFEVLKRNNKIRSFKIEDSYSP